MENKIKAIMGNNEATMDDFMAQYDRLVRSVANTKRNLIRTKDEIEDLYQDGLVILFECLENYDVTIGKVKFSTYFTNHFRFWLSKNFKEKYDGIKTSNRALMDQAKLYKQSNKQKKLGNIKSSNMLYQQASNITVNFFQLGKSSDMEMWQIIDQLAEEKQDRNLLADRIVSICCDVLCEEDINIINKLFGLNGDKMKAKDLANELGIHRTTLHQHKVRILNQLKGVVEHDLSTNI